MNDKVETLQINDNEKKTKTPQHGPHVTSNGFSLLSIFFWGASQQDDHHYRHCHQHHQANHI